MKSNQAMWDKMRADIEDARGYADGLDPWEVYRVLDDIESLVTGKKVDKSPYNENDFFKEEE